MRARLTIALCIVLLPAAARAADTGELLQKEGMREYDAGRYGAAIVKLEQAYAASHDGAILYALGQAKRRNGDCRGAIETFEAFVATHPPTSAVGAARFQIARCLEQLARSQPPPTPAPPTPTPTTTTPLVGASARAAPRWRWYKDAAGDSLLAAGVVAAAAGGALFGVAETRARDAGVDLASYRDAQSVGALRTAAIVVTSAGAVLVVGAIVRYAVAGHSHQRDAAVPTSRPIASAQKAATPPQ